MCSHLLVLLGFLFLDWPFASAAVLETTAKGYHALLVGCTRYPSLGKFAELEGPANDVVLMRTLLIDRFKFPPRSIVVLTEDRGEHHRPTRANIEREFKNLEKAARPGDRVVILLAGHGSYQPDQPPLDEADGRDELFLPADISGWDRNRQRVKNAIVDDELSLWLEAIQGKEASIWLVIDSCHSGTMIRGRGIERPRRLKPDNLGIPSEAFRPAYRPQGDASEAAAFDLPRESGELVAIYAARPEETAPETLLPEVASPARYYGLLTYTLCEILDKTTVPLSYRQLVQRIHERYAARGRFGPTPMIEGAFQDRRVLGSDLLDSARIRLARDGEGWSIDAGAVHGLTEGSILAVSEIDTSGQPGNVVGHVSIIEGQLEPIRARVRPCAYAGGGTVSDHLPASGLCRPVAINFRLLRQKLAADPADDQGRALPEVDRRRVVEARDALAAAIATETKRREAEARPGPGKAALVEVVSDRAQADWLLRINTAGGHDMYLVPAAGIDRSVNPGDLPPLFGPVPPGAPAGSWLLDRVSRIAGARNLLKIAGNPPASVLANNSGLKLEVQLVPLKDCNDTRGQPLTAPNGVLELRDGDHIGVSLRNRGADPLDVTLLFIDSGFGVEPLFPREPGFSNRLAPGDSVLRRFLVSSEKTTGWEHLLAIAVKSANLELGADFSFLKQDTIEKARGMVQSRGGAASRELDSPFGQLLRMARYEPTRGKLVGASIGDHRLQLITWRTLARPTTKQGHH
jgi:hypothetical protein